MKRLFFLIEIILLTACQTTRQINWPMQNNSSLTGSSFYKNAAAMTWQKRDSLAVNEILAGNIPSFLKKFVPVHVSITTPEGKIIKATYYVAPDYVSIGSDDDWARIPLTPNAAQKIADKTDCFLTTRKIADDIYKSAKVKLEPVPLYAFRDSTPTMWHHHLIIEGQRKGRKGLIAGIKKDVVISGKISHDTFARRIGANRVAIYGWHKPDGKPIQPLYTGHVNWYVDYSHGIRLVYRKIKVSLPAGRAGSQWMDYIDVMKDPILQKLICDEEYCDFTRY